MSSLPVAAIGARPASGEGSIGPADADEVHRFAKANGILVSALAKGEYKQLVRVPTLTRPVREAAPGKVALIGIAQKIPAPALVDLRHLTRKAVPPEAIRRRAASQPPRVISIPPRRWP